MKKIIIKSSICLLAVASLFACSNKAKRQPPVDLSQRSKTEVTKNVVVPYTEVGGVKMIPVKINGVSMSMIVDTGCSGISISWNESISLIKNGQLDDSDYLGEAESFLADGSRSKTSEARARIREIEIGGKDGIVLRNCEARIVRNMDAPALLGSTVLDVVDSVEFDNKNKTIIFKRH